MKTLTTHFFEDKHFKCLEQMCIEPKLWNIDLPVLQRGCISTSCCGSKIIRQCSNVL